MFTETDLFFPLQMFRLSVSHLRQWIPIEERVGKGSRVGFLSRLKPLAEEWHMG